MTAARAVDIRFVEAHAIGGRLAKHVFILGAGASRDAGGPLMFDFLDKAEDLLRAKPPGVTIESFEAVFAALHELRAVHAKGALDTQNVESVFSAFEMAQLFGRLGPFGPEVVDSLPKAISTLIAQTVEQSIDFTESERRLAPHSSFMALSDVIKAMVNAGGPDSVAVLTFNYDIGVEVALQANQIFPRYRLEGEQIQTGPGVDFLKLHGSTVWTRREERIESFDLFSYLNTHRFSHVKPERAEAGPHVVSTRIGGDPFIVPPSWSKLQYYRPIGPVWRAAVDHLSNAENIYVFGYSLPESDSFFKLLYSLGTIGTTRLRRFWVFDPDESPTGAQRRFRALLGPEAASRFGYAPLKFVPGMRVLSNCWEPGKSLKLPDEKKPR